MKISGTYALALTRERAFEAMQNPELLAKCIPGCEGLSKIGEDEYQMNMKVVMAAVSGQFAGKVKLSDSVAPASFRLNVEGTGKIGFLKGSGLLNLAENEAVTTTVTYDGDVNIGGTIAAVGQRLMETTAKMMIKKFFDKLAKEAAV